MLTKLRLAVALAWLPAALYMALIWTISSLSLTDVSVSRVPLGDKGVHFVEYGVLAFLLAHAALRCGASSTRFTRGSCPVARPKRSTWWPTRRGPPWAQRCATPSRWCGRA